MIKISQPVASQVSAMPFPLLKRTQSSRDSLKLYPLSFLNLNGKIHRYPTSTIIVDSNQYEKLKQILFWRQKTEFPIVKVRSFKLMNENETTQTKLFEILVQLQCEMKPLSQIKKITFVQAMSILKQSMIGFERLCHRFGFFTPEAQMIKINQNQKCRVWINEDCFSNYTSMGSVTSEKSFVLELCKIVERKSVKSKISIQFFGKIKTCKYFFEAICAIDTYAKKNKIIIPNRIQILEDRKPELSKSQLNVEKGLEENKNKLNPVKQSKIKIPQFIRQNRIKKTISNEIDSPQHRKMTPGKQGPIKNRSIFNITRHNSSIGLLKYDISQNILSSQDDKVEKQGLFVADMNIRLIQPKSVERNSTIPQSPNIYQEYDNFPQSPQSPSSPYGRMTEFDFDENKRSGFSFNRCASKQEISLFETTDKLLLTVHKPMREKNETESSSPQREFQHSSRCINTSQYLEEQQSFEEFSKPQAGEDKFTPLSISQIRDRRKHSVDYNSFSRIESFTKLMQREQNSPPKYQSQNLLMIPHKKQRKTHLIKSPSQKIISNKFIPKNFQFDRDDNQDEFFLRQTINTIRQTNGLKGLERLSHSNTKVQSIQDNDQFTFVRAKTCELHNLEFMQAIQNVRNLKDSQSGEDDTEERYFLRDTTMQKNGWGRLELLNDPTSIQQSIMESEQIPYMRSKTCEIPKLGGMGRDVNTSMIGDFEFQLEYQDQLQKEKSVRNEVLSVLN